MSFNNNKILMTEIDMGRDVDCIGYYSLFSQEKERSRHITKWGNNCFY